MFFAFDPTFYTIMEALSNSLRLSSPPIDHLPTRSSSQGDNIEIHISSELDEMPCHTDAAYALSMALDG